LNVTCVPRGTVMFCGQTALFEIVIVVDVELAVHVLPVEGPALFELPQPVDSTAMTHANSDAGATRLV